MSTTKPRAWWLGQPSNDGRAAKRNVHHHDDLGNDFYRLWLDREMVYTCASVRRHRIGMFPRVPTAVQ